MNEEEIREVKRVNDERERHLEAQIINFEKEKIRIFKKAKEEAHQEEKKKRARFQAKVEKIKRQEMAAFQKEIIGKPDLVRQGIHTLENSMMSVDQSFYPNGNNNKLLLSDIVVPK